MGGLEDWWGTLLRNRTPMTPRFGGSTPVAGSPSAQQNIWSGAMPGATTGMARALSGALGSGGQPQSSAGAAAQMLGPQLPGSGSITPAGGGSTAPRPGAAFAGGSPRGIGGFSGGIRAMGAEALAGRGQALTGTQGTAPGAGLGGGMELPSTTNTALYQLPTMTAGNTQAFEAAMGMVEGQPTAPGAGTPAFGQSEQTINALIESENATARKYFDENVMPSIQHTFAQQGAMDSQAYHDTVARAREELETQLAQNASQRQYDELNVQRGEAVRSQQSALQQWMHTQPQGGQQLAGALQAANIPMFTYYAQAGTTQADALAAGGSGFVSGFQQQQQGGGGNSGFAAMALANASKYNYA